MQSDYLIYIYLYIDIFKIKLTLIQVIFSLLELIPENYKLVITYYLKHIYFSNRLLVIIPRIIFYFIIIYKIINHT